MVTILTPLTESKYNVENSYEFAKEIVTIRNAHNYTMASFDVCNIFTNVPLSETIDIIMEKYFTDPSSTFMGFTKLLFKSMLQLAVQTSFVIFD